FTDKFFVDVSTNETVDTSLKNVAIRKNLGNSAQDALLLLATKHEEWLLLFDNADDPEIDLNQFFPKCSHGNIIITTRNPALRVYGAHALVSNMGEEEAVKLLLQSAAQQYSPINEHFAAEIELGYLPLAIIQAGAFISESGAIDTYLPLYKENRAQLLSKKPAQTHDDYAWTVYTTWQMSFDRLSPLAAMFLQLCSFLHRDGISEEIFSRAVEYSFPAWGPSKVQLQKPVKFLTNLLGPTGKWDSLRFLKLTNEIKAYSLINFDPVGKIFSIHPLVHGWTRTTLADEESHQSSMTAILGMAIEEIPDADIPVTSLRLISHVDCLMGSIPERAGDFALQYASIYNYARWYTDAKELG
ncbi:hypothetical protein B0H14DRAFT_2167916, partial [Mycena olivaceomarginata]